MKVLQVAYRASSLSALAGLAVLAAAPTALGQAPAPQPPPVIQPLPQDPAAAPPAELPPPPEFPPPAPLAAPAPVEPQKAGPQGLHFSAFVDANYGFQTAKPGTPSPVHRAYEWNNFAVDGNGNNTFSAQNGFG